MHEIYPSFIFRDQASNFCRAASNRLGMKLVAYHPSAHTLSIHIANSQGHTQFSSNSFVTLSLPTSPLVLIAMHHSKKTRRFLRTFSLHVQFCGITLY